MPTDHGALYLLRIEVDGHFHGSPMVPRPWVARIGKPCDRFGLEREFIKPMNDWQDARVAWSGNLYGVVAMFALREGATYEVARCRGKPSKRYFDRQFYCVEGRRLHERTPDEVLAWSEATADPASAEDRVVILRVPDTDDRPWVAEVSGLGMPRRLGFVVVDSHRRYRLRERRIYEVRSADDDGAERRRLLGVSDGTTVDLTQEEAAGWLRRSA